MEILVSLACLVQHLSHASLCRPTIFSHNHQLSSSLPWLLEASALEGYMSELPTGVSHSIWPVGNTGMSSRYFFNAVLGSFLPVVIRHLTRRNLRERGSFYLLVGGDKSILVGSLAAGRWGNKALCQQLRIGEVWMLAFLFSPLQSGTQAV